MRLGGREGQALYRNPEPALPLASRNHELQLVLTHAKTPAILRLVAP